MAPMTQRERSQKFRDRAKANGKIIEINKKQTSRIKKRREIQKTKTRELSIRHQHRLTAENRKYCREGMQKFRLKTKTTASPSASPATSPASPATPAAPTTFKNNIALHRAVKKVKRALPANVDQQIEVINKISNKLSPFQTPSPSNQRKVSEENAKGITRVIQFYLDDAISRVSPNRKDFIKIKDADNVVTTHQIRHMYCTLAEAFELFKEANKDIKIGRSKFMDLRPKYVRLIGSIPMNVCCCTIHENMKMALDALFMSNRLLFANLKFSGLFFDKLICSSPTISCYINECVLCKDGTIFHRLFEIEENFENNQVKWNTWVRSVAANLFHQQWCRMFCSKTKIWYLHILINFLKIYRNQQKK
jgi:hypothetical protein